MKRKIVVLWIISCLAVSSAKAQFNTVSDNVCRYKVRKVEEKLSDKSTIVGGLILIAIGLEIFLTGIFG